LALARLAERGLRAPEGLLEGVGCFSIGTGVLHDRCDSLRVVRSVVVVAEPNKPAVHDNRRRVADIKCAMVHGRSRGDDWGGVFPPRALE
jgi:hypothetical protein